MENQINKTVQLDKRPVNAERDIELINRHSLKELKPEDVFVFSVVLCDNNIDRDNEGFDSPGLMKMAQLFEGKTGIFNHSWDANDQVARIYKAVVETTDEKNTLGEPEKRLLASAYILREYNGELISKIEGGILKEVSIGFRVEKVECSICGKRMMRRSCEDGHVKGKEVDGKLCYGLLKNPTEAYEFSFVAVPAQRNAGVVKGLEDVQKAVKDILATDLSEYPEQAEQIIEHCKTSLMKDEERARREELITINKNLTEERK